jgi:N-acetylglucosamine kinase-like BadF-type ATPase
MPDQADLRVLGLDVGGSHSRALLADATGARLGVGYAAGGNPATHGAHAAADRIRHALVGALGDTGPAEVAACVIGIAGAGRLASEPDAALAIEAMAADVGLVCGVRLVSDVTVAFAAGTTRPDGALLLSGTGAVAARMRDREPVEIRDGYGWLLGDEGSGFWIGREAVRATLAAIDGRAPMTELPRLVLRHFVDRVEGGGEGGAGSGAESGAKSGTGAARSGAGQHRLGDAFARDDRRLATELVRAVGASPTIAMAELAPAVMAAAGLGDPAAERIVADAAARLVESLASLERGSEVGAEAARGAAIVLAGSVLTNASPVHDLVTKAISERWPEAELGIAADGAAGAAWLALRGLAGGRSRGLHGARGLTAERIAAAHARLTAR